MQLRRRPSSSGQPSPAGLDAGPLELAEAGRGERDDVIREHMAGEAIYGRAEGIAEPGPTPEPPATTQLYRLLSGQYRHTITAAQNVPIGGVNQLAFSEEVRAGMIFIIRAIRCQAPAGARLQLYQDAIQPTNFREVVANVQEFSGEPPGTLVVRGPSRLLAVITLTTAEGLAVIRLEGDLVKREPVTEVY